MDNNVDVEKEAILSQFQNGGLDPLTFEAQMARLEAKHRPLDEDGE